MITKLGVYLSITVVISISSFLFLWNLGQRTLADWDEAWYADATRHMFRYDHFLTPVWNGQYFFDKPPLQYWLTQPFLYLLGEKELAFRLPSALSSIAVVMLLLRWGSEIGRQKNRRDSLFAGVSAAIILLSFPHFIDRGRSGNFDGLFLFLTTLALYTFLRRTHWLAGIFLGLAWLTKGVLPGLFPVATISFFVLYDLLKHKSIVTLKHLLVFVGVAVLVYIPWHLIELNRFEDLIEKSYFSSFDQGEFGDRSWMSIVWRFDFRYLVFLWTFLRWWFPVSLFSIIWMMVKLDESARLKKPPATEQLLQSYIPIVVFLVVFIALSAAKAKNDWYIMPTYPFLALMISQLLFSVIRRKTIATAVIMLVATGNLFWYRKQAFPYDRWAVEKEVAYAVKQVSDPNELIVTTEYEFPTLRYYSERQVRTATRQPDFSGKYWWIWDNTDIATALRHGQRIVTIHRPGTEWLIDVPGYERQYIRELHDRVISRLTPVREAPN